MRHAVLDHGYVEFVESWGSDERIIESARMSTQKGFQGWGPKDDGSPGDEKLLRYLWKEGHTTPFEFAGMAIEVCAPIFVFREWHRHRTQSYSEASARYAPLPDLDYIPSVERILLGGGHLTKQAAAADGSAPVNADGADWFRAELDNLHEHAQCLYNDAINRGVPKEIARLALTVGRYSTMRATANLRNWLAFEKLRLATNAQWEIRQYAEAVGSLLESTFPRTWALFKEHP